MRFHVVHLEVVLEGSMNTTMYENLL